MVSGEFTKVKIGGISGSYPECKYIRIKFGEYDNEPDFQVLNNNPNSIYTYNTYHSGLVNGTTVTVTLLNGDKGEIASKSGITWGSFTG